MPLLKQSQQPALDPADAAANSHTDAVMEKMLAGAAGITALAALSRGAIGIFDRFNRTPLLKARRPRRTVIELPYVKKSAVGSLSGPGEIAGAGGGMLTTDALRSLGSGGAPPAGEAIDNRRSILAPPPQQAPNPHGIPQYLAERAHAWANGGGQAWRATPAGRASSEAHSAMGTLPTNPAIRRPGEPYLPSRGAWTAPVPSATTDAGHTFGEMASAKETLQGRPGPATLFAPGKGMTTASTAAPPSLGNKPAPVLTSQVGFGNRAARARFQARGGNSLGSKPAGVGRAATAPITPLGPTPGSVGTAAATTHPAPKMPVAPGGIPGLPPLKPPGALAGIGIKGHVVPMPSGQKLAEETVFTEPAKGFSGLLGLHRTPESPTGSNFVRDQLFPVDSTSLGTTPGAWAMVPPLAAASAYAGWKPVDAAFKWMRGADDEDEIAESKGRYERLLREQAAYKDASAEGEPTAADAVEALAKEAGWGDAVEYGKGTLAFLGSLGLLAGGVGGYNIARSGSSDKVLAAALRQRRADQLASGPHPFYVKPVAIPEPAPEIEDEGEDEEGV